MRPILFHLGPFPVRAYGFMVFLGFLCAQYYTRAMAGRRLAALSHAECDGKTGGGQGRPPAPITPDDVSRVALVGLWVGILGARLLFVAMDWKDYRSRLEMILQVWEGGMTAYGAILFGLVYVALYCRKRRIPFLDFADLIAPAIAFVYGIGRIGCFLNGCCYGAPTDLPWACVFVRDGHPDHGLTPPSHPAQLYSSAMNLAIFAILHLRSRHPFRRGEIFFGYAALFLLYRTAYEQFRKGFTADIFVFGMTHAQVFNMILLPVVLLLLLRARKLGAVVPGYASWREADRAAAPAAASR